MAGYSISQHTVEIQWVSRCPDRMTGGTEAGTWWAEWPGCVRLRHRMTDTVLGREGLVTF